MDNSYDVAIIGGGPAGAAAATFLQQQGHRCIIAEKTTFPRYHVGESLIPHTYGTLERLGLLKKMEQSNYPEKHSVRFVRPSGASSDPFYFDEVISGEGSRTWQVDRASFDTLCLENAKEQGVEVLSDTRVKHVLFNDTQAVGLQIQTGAEPPRDINARVIIDASGRATVIGKQLELRTAVPGLHKASIWAYYKGGKRYPGRDAGETTIFTRSDGSWFWYIPLPDDMISVGLVGDPTTLLQPGMTYDSILTTEIEASPLVAERLEHATCVDRTRGLHEMSYVNREMGGDGWVMIGDSAAFLDPIYSSGLYLALASGELAAESIHAALEADDLSAAALNSFRNDLLGGVDVIRRLIFAFYDPTFSFGKFATTFPEHRSALIDCLIGDVVGKDMSSFLSALKTMTPDPPPLLQTEPHETSETH